MPRNGAKEKFPTICARGSSRVSRITNYVVAGADAGSKLVKAESLGVPVLNEQALTRILDGDFGVIDQ